MTVLSFQLVTSFHMHVATRDFLKRNKRVMALGLLHRCGVGWGGSGCWHYSN